MNKNIQYKKLGDICDFISGGTPSKSKIEYWKDGNIPWIKISDFKEKYIKISDEKITRTGLNNSSAKILEKGTILYTIFASVGKVAVLDIEATTNQAIVGINLKKDISIDKNFLYYFLCSIENNVKNQARGVAQNNININILKNINIPIFSLSLQKNIVKILSKVETLLENLKQKKSLVNLLNKSLFTRMFGDIRNNSFNWKKVKLQDVCSSIVRGPFGSSLKKEFFVKNGYKVYEQKNAINQSVDLGEYYIDEKKFKELQRFECKTGDIIMSCSGTVGKLFQLPENSKRGIINQALCKFSLNNKIKSTYFLKYLEKVIGNMELNGSGIKNISSVSYIKKVDINLPPIELQNKFAERIEKIEKLKFEIEKSIEMVQNLYDSLISKYFDN